MLVMLLRFLYHTPRLQRQGPKESESLSGEKNFDWEDYNYDRDAGDTGPAVTLLVALLDCIPGFNTAQLEELLRKLLMPNDEEVPGLTM